MTVKKMLLSAQEQQVAGQELLTTTQTWVVPAGVTSISVAAFDPGAKGSQGSQGLNATGGLGGLGGLVRFANNVAVTPGQSIQVTINATDAIFGSIVSGKAGGTEGLRGGTGGTGGSSTSTGTNVGGGGGNSGPATSITNPDTTAPGVSAGGGGGVNSVGGAGATGSFPGGGGGGGGGGTSPGPGGAGGAGAVYIIWSGAERQFPSMRTGFEISGEISWQLVPFLDTSMAQIPPAVANNGNGIWLVFSGVSDAFHYRSTDNGKTFTKVTRSTTRRVTGLVCANGVFVASTRDSVVMRSLDGGITWIEVATVSAFCIGYSGSRIMICGYTSTATAEGIAFSDDNGASWKKASSLYTSSNNPLVSVAYAGGIWWAVSSPGRAQRSTDNGVTWSSSATQIGYLNVLGSPPLFIAIKPADFVIYTAALASSQFTAGPSVGPTDHTYLSTGPSRIFLSGVSKLLQSFDNSLTWVNQPTLANNTSGRNQTLGRVVGDGYGVFLVVGNNGFIMRGELK